MRDERLPGKEEIERNFEELYAEHFDSLVAIAVRKFRVPEADAEALAHEVFLTCVRRSDGIRDVRAWIFNAIHHAARYYWRQNGRIIEPLSDEQAFEQPDPASEWILDPLPDQLAARRALEALLPRDQEILKMRYFEGCSVIEIAARLGVKPKAAQRLLIKVLRRVERNQRRRENRVEGSLAVQADAHQEPLNDNWRESEGLREVLTSFIEAYSNL